MPSNNNLIWMLVDHSVAHGTGYSRRVLFELEILNKYIGKPVLIYPKGIQIPKSILDLVIPFEIILERPIIKNYKSIKSELKGVEKQFGRPSVVYGQNLSCSFLASCYTSDMDIPLIFDYHGVVSEEVGAEKNRVTSFLLKNLFRFIERKTLKRCTLLITVSNNFRDLVGLENKKSIVLPMLPSKVFSSNISCEKGEILPELKNKTVFCYLGQAQLWQLPEETLCFYKNIEKYNPNTHLLIFSKDKEVFNSAAKKYNLCNYTVLEIEHESVPKYLRICDYGFVLRGPSNINKVSSPTKVLEYVSQGVTPIMTEFVGDYSSELVKQNIGILTPYKSLNETIFDISKIKVENNVTIGSQFVDDYRKRYIQEFVKSISQLVSLDSKECIK